MASTATSTQRLTAWLFRNHRWFGIWPCVFVMMWGASGVLHPIMSRLSPQAVAMMPPQVVVSLHEALSPAEVLQKHGIKEVSGLRVVSFGGVSYYQMTLAPSPSMGEGRGEGGNVGTTSNAAPLSLTLPHKGGENRSIRRYFNVTTGDELIDGDVQYAQLLARHFTGDTKSSIVKVTLIEKFDDDYLSVNRLLPVYRVDLARDDGLRIYIETSPARAGALVDNTKATLGMVFNWMHTWTFMNGIDTTRKIFISALLALTLMSSLSGVWIYGYMYKRRTLSSAHAPLRRWHRGVAIAVSLASILFVVSAEWHLLGSASRESPAPIVTRIASELLGLPDAIRHGSWASINAVQVNGHTYYEVAESSHGGSTAMGEHAEHDHSMQTHRDGQSSKRPQVQYVDAASGEVSADVIRQHAVSIASQYSGLPEAQVATAEPVFKFEDEYGFLNKRLPVWRVRYNTPDHVAFYVETSSGALATVVRDADRAEGYSFAFLHKYHWLDFAGKNVRDVVNALFALGMVVVAALGLWMFTKRYTKKGIG